MADYVDRLAADIGSPPCIERAQALVQRLPVAVRISGPQDNWRSHVEHFGVKAGMTFGFAKSTGLNRQA